MKLTVIVLKSAFMWFLIAFFVMWAAIAYSSGEVDPSMWKPFQRTLQIMLSLVVSAMAAFVTWDLKS
jgi:hypothetical protein